jgi:primosomal protein N' (replication factor Y)
MKCHYCGQKAQKPKFCVKCHSTNLNERGVGIEQIEEELQKILPEAQVERMDVDSMRRKFAYEKLYEKIDSGEAEVIVGTQMISKGLDFDNIELVAIPKADSMLYVQDFRAEERAYQLITQVSGRAGRISGKGKVVIQTYNPSHPLFTMISGQDNDKIYQHFLQERQQFLYPPFVKMILIELKHRKEEKVNRASQFLSSVLQKYLPMQCVLGPEKAPIGRINLMYQYQILLKLPRGKKYQEYKENILKALEEFNEITAYKSIKIDAFVDV